MNGAWTLLQEGGGQGITWSPTALIIAAVLMLLVFLFLRFVIKSVVSLVKIAVIVLIGIGAYLGFQTIV